MPGPAADVEQAAGRRPAATPGQVRRDVLRPAGQGQRQRPGRRLALHRRLDPLAEDERGARLARPPPPAGRFVRSRSTISTHARRLSAARPSSRSRRTRRRGRGARGPGRRRLEPARRVGREQAHRPQRRDEHDGGPLGQAERVRGARRTTSAVAQRAEDVEVRHGRRQQFGAVAAAEVLEDGGGVGFGGTMAERGMGFIPRR